MNRARWLRLGIAGGVAAGSAYLVWKAVRRQSKCTAISDVAPPGAALTPGTGWKEAYLDGSPEAEARLIDGFVRQINEIQENIRARTDAPVVRRAFHAKQHAGITNAEFRIMPDLPNWLQIGFFRPGAVYPATVRLSNASGKIQPDRKGDLRGVALRIHTGEGTVQDFLMTNAPASHARDARQFMVVARALAPRTPLLTPVLLLCGLGFRETLRVLGVLRRDSSRTVASLAAERYWSRSPLALGPYALRFLLAPAPAVRAIAVPEDENYLRDDLKRRLRNEPIVFQFQLQFFVNERETPIEDGSIEWTESAAPPITVGQLVIPAQDLDAEEAAGREQAVNDLEFNPWHTTSELRPLGSLNRARKRVYESSAALRARSHTGRRDRDSS